MLGRGCLGVNLLNLSIICPTQKIREFTQDISVSDPLVFIFMLEPVSMIFLRISFYEIIYEKNKIENNSIAIEDNLSRKMFLLFRLPPVFLMGLGVRHIWRRLLV